MNDRVKSLQRIVKVRTQMQRLAEWRLAASERKRLQIETSREDLDVFLAQPEPLGALAAAAHRQDKRLAAGAVVATAHRDLMAEARLAAERRLKTAETLAREVGRAVRTTQERAALERLIEATLGRVAEDQPE